MALKTLSINTAAAWSSGTRSYKSGDLFNEANCDSVFGDLADRLGYLKGQSDLSPRLAGPNAFTGTATYAGAQTYSSNVQFNGPVVHTAQINTSAMVVCTGVGGGLNVSSSCTFTVACAAIFQGAGFNDQVDFNSGALVNFNGPGPTFARGLRPFSSNLTDANTTMAATVTGLVRVPTVTANRTYTLPNTTNDSRIIRLVRPKADAFSVTLQTNGAVVMGIIGTSSQGWIEVQDLPTVGWAVVGWGGTSVTSLSNL